MPDASTFRVGCNSFRVSYSGAKTLPENETPTVGGAITPESGDGELIAKSRHLTLALTRAGLG